MVRLSLAFGGEVAPTGTLRRSLWVVLWAAMATVFGGGGAAVWASFLQLPKSNLALVKLEGRKTVTKLNFKSLLP